MSVLAGQKVRASDFNNILAPGWTTYGSDTTTLTATTSNPTKGNSTYAAQYRRSSGSDKVEVRIRIDIGSTFSVGSGNYLFLLPFPASANGILRHIGNNLIFDTGTAYRQAIAVIQDSTHFAIAVAGSAIVINNTGSGTAWANGDYIIANVEYEPA